MSQTQPEPPADSPFPASAGFGRAQRASPPPPWETLPPASAQPSLGNRPTYAQSGNAQPILPPPPSPSLYGQRGWSVELAPFLERFVNVPPPVYNQPPMQVSPLGGTVVPLPIQQVSTSDSRNFLGWLSLIAPFVGFSAIGVVCGHLALKAVKRGEASNSGIALAGTIISWVFTGFVTLAVLGFVAIIAFAPRQDPAQDAVMKSNLKALQMAAAREIDDGQTPTLTLANHMYYVGNSIVAADSTVTDARLYTRGNDSFCIEIDYGDSLVRSIDDGGSFGYGC